MGSRFRYISEYRTDRAQEPFDPHPGPFASPAPLGDDGVVVESIEDYDERKNPDPKPEGMGGVAGAYVRAQTDKPPIQGEPVDDGSGQRSWDPDEYAQDGPQGDKRKSRSDLLLGIREPIMNWWRAWQREGFGFILMEYTSIIRNAAEPDANGWGILAAPLLAIGIPLGLVPPLFAGPLGWILGAPVLLATLAGLVAVTLFWFTWRDDPQRVADALNTRRGFMTSHEIARAYGPRQLVTRAPRFLPRTAKRRRAAGLPIRPWDAGVLMGHSHGVEVWATVEQPIYTVAPARMGKTRDFVLPLVLGAPGPVITTSTRRDVVDQTRAMRESGWIDPDGVRHPGGRCWVFDPMRVARGNPGHTLNWSPIDGCEDPHIARQRAADLMGTTGLSGDNETWKTQGGLIVQALLHAAALKEGGSLEDVYQWSRSYSAAQQAARILESAAVDPKYEKLRARGAIATDWNMELEELKVDDARMKGNKWFAVNQAFAALSEPTVRAALSVAHDDPGRFSIADFLNSHDTVYMLCPFRNAEGDGPAGVGTFVSMFLTAVVDEARRQAADSVGMGRLEPPVALILDEIANIDQWGMLPQVVTAGSGDGIWATAIYQSRSQARARYGDDTERELWDSSQKWILGGVANPSDLRDLSDLLGTRRIKRSEVSHDGLKVEYGRVSERIEDVPVLSVKEAHEIPEDMGLYLSGRNRAAIVNLIPPERRGWTAMNGGK